VSQRRQRNESVVDKSAVDKHPDGENAQSGAGRRADKRGPRRGAGLEVLQFTRGTQETAPRKRGGARAGKENKGERCACAFLWDVSAIAQRLFLLSVLFFWVPRLPLSGTAAKPSEDKPVAKRARKKDSAIDSFAKLAAAYGHPSLRGFQQTAISGVVEGKHVVMVVGVGGGKTLPLEASIFHARNMGRGNSASQALVFVGSTDDVMATFAREMNERFPAVEGGVPVALHVTADTSQRELRAALNGTYAVVYAGPQHLTIQGKLA
jgi:hypothetical protein